MARNWTDEQKKVIELHHRNILVSAAAGSGKTAVLVERIIKMVTDPDKNIDIDKLVVVTFTKAAAGEMRQRISEAIEERLELNPEDEKLQKQLTLIHNAQITTIDSFCLNIVRNNFTSADIDPGFRTADEGELKLLEADVMGKILEEYYESDRREYFDFVDSYGAGKSDVAIEELIYKVYNFSRSYPWPLMWLENCKKSYEITNETMLNDNIAVEYMTDYVKKIIVDYEKKYSKLEVICKETGGPDMYEPMIASDQANIINMLEAQTFEELGTMINNVSFERLSGKKGTEVDPEKKEYVKFYRDQYKKVIGDLQKKIFKQSMEQNFEDILINISSINVLIELAIRFYEDMKAAKKEKNIIDFNDMEHLALDILVKNENGTLVFSDVANRLSSFYEEILIDEYQDSNLLQEQILYSISKGRTDAQKNNMFMVGDVKQSIYKFRLARPELFIEKYNKYSEEDSLNQKIELRKNFRSRNNVLMSINDVFFHVMKDYFGGIEYDENVMLNTGMEYQIPDTADLTRIGGDTEVIIVNTKPSENQEQTEENVKKLQETDEEEQELVDRELEAKEIAVRIKQLTNPDSGQKIYDSKIKAYRQAQYKDIVILTRTVRGWADTFVNVLMNFGIPAFSDTSSGYFNTREIKLLLCFLAVIDNPIQDIPLAAVLTSYFGNFTSQELAEIRKESKDVKLYQSVIGYQGTDLIIIGKIEQFLMNLDKYRKISIYTDIHDLIWQMVYDTGYYDYTGTMPAGIKRQANLDMLIEKAKSYESTSYRGLFNFLRYIDKLKKYDVDYGEATLLGENENLVRIMSIHKSKGLEFPIVVLAGMSKSFNNRDAAASVVIDAELGIGTSAVNLEKRTKSPTVIKNAIGLKIRLDNMYEELRVLYVALTRAKEKLIMIGTVKNPEKTYDVWMNKAAALDEDDSAYSFADLEKSNNYFELVAPTAMKKSGNSGKFDVKLISVEEILRQEKAYNFDVLDYEQTDSTNLENDNYNLDNANADDDNLDDDKLDNDNLDNDKLDNANSDDDSAEPASIKHLENPNLKKEYIYPYKNATNMKGKMTVSELKKMQHQAEETDEIIYESEFKELNEETAIIPKFIAGEQKLQGAERGTAYHRVMECFNYDYSDSAEKVAECLKSLKDSHKIMQEQFDVIDITKIFAFCNSAIGKRIKSEYGNTLRREQQFVYGIEPEKGELILIQGVIDLYFEEDGKIVILDYKTDHVPSGDPGKQMLIDRYKVQLDYYSQAIEQLTGKTVSQKIIYSFERNEEIWL